MPLPPLESARCRCGQRLQALRVTVSGLRLLRKLIGWRSQPQTVGSNLPAGHVLHFLAGLAAAQAWLQAGDAGFPGLQPERQRIRPPRLELRNALSWMPSLAGRWVEQRQQVLVEGAR